MNAKVLKGIFRIGIDTAPFIYFIEANPNYDQYLTPIFSAISQAKLIGITSTISITEVLVHPLRNGNVELALQYRNLLMNSQHLICRPVDAEIAELAASLRVKYQLRTPDALQIATAILANAEAFLTNDKNLKRVKELKVIIMDDLF